jgi:5-methylcytosine-specific restriction protein A
VTAANQVDHIVPKAKGGTDHEGNLEALCRPCHETKTIIDAGGKPKLTIGADGWPV